MLTKKLIKNKYISWTLRGLVSTTILPLTIASTLAYVGHQNQHTNIRNIQNKPLPAKIKVATVNTAFGAGRKFGWTSDLFKSKLTKKTDKGLKGIEKILRNEKVNLACLNETGYSGVRNNEDQVKNTADNTQLKNYIFGSNIAFNAKYLSTENLLYREDLLLNGNAILSTSRLISTTHIPSLEHEKPFSWSTFFDSLVGSEGILHASINYEGTLINIYCNHFSNEEFPAFINPEKFEKDRVTEAKILASMITAPAIILGDFNTVPLSSRDINFGEEDKQKYKNEETLIEFVKGLEKKGYIIQFEDKEMMNPFTQKSFKGTYIGEIPFNELGKPNNRPEKNQKIDYIITVNNPRSKLELIIKNSKTNCDYLNSDHCAVIGEININKK